MQLRREADEANKQKYEIESALRQEIQRWKNDLESAERRLKQAQEELKSIQNKLNQVQQDHDNLQRQTAQKQSHMS